MVVLPAAPPVTSPVAISTDAIVGLALVQSPAGVELASVVVESEQTTAVPVIGAGKGLIVILVVALPQPVV